MKVIKAAEQMIPLVRGTVYGDIESATEEHLMHMISLIINGTVDGEKAHRWLGYLQGVVIAYEGTTLEELKQINFTS